MYKGPIVIEKAITKNGEIQLQKRGNDYEIIFNGTFLMATYNGESEKLLVRWAMEMVNLPKTVLIAGLGVGFSLAEAQNYKLVDKITVVEIEQKIIEWYSTYFVAFHSDVPVKPEICVVNGDFTQWIKKNQHKYAVICIDIDNGPDWTVLDKNNKLYSEEGICNLVKIMKEDGAVSFWSATESNEFETRLGRFFNGVYLKRVRNERGKPDCIYLANKPKVTA